MLTFDVGHFTQQKDIEVVDPGEPWPYFLLARIDTFN